MSTVDVTQSRVSQQARLRAIALLGSAFPPVDVLPDLTLAMTAELLKLSNIFHPICGSGCPPGNLCCGSPCPSSAVRHFSCLWAHSVPDHSQANLRYCRWHLGHVGKLRILSAPAPAFPCHSILAPGTLEGHFLPACQTDPGHESSLPSCLPTSFWGSHHPFPPKDLDPGAFYKDPHH